MEKINLGIVAHVDAGKTTLTERILYVTGAIRQLGSVDRGSAHTDRMEIERRRGISVQSSAIQVIWNDVEINVIDTPGHMDFSAEVERALIALECAVLVVSAVERVQPQTEVIFKALREMGIPALFFINKTDRIGADATGTVTDIENKLNVRLCNYTDLEDLVEKLCENDDEMLAQYVEQGITSFDLNQIKHRLANQFCTGSLSLYTSGSALHGVGIEALLTLIVDVCPRFCDRSVGGLSGIVFKIEHEKAWGRLAHVKLYGGELKNRDLVHNHTLDVDEKVTQIRKNQGAKTMETGMLQAGDIGIVSGLTQARVGDILGDPIHLAGREYKMTVPLLKARVLPVNEGDYPALAAAIDELQAEDPLLDAAWIREKRELVVNITGLIQIEILQVILSERFGLAAQFEQPSVIYKETPSEAAEGYDAYTMPKPCWAVLRFWIEPAERGSGVALISKVNADKILPAYQAQIRQALPEALRQGPMGWEVTDVRITLMDGEHHILHTHPLDFIVATPMAIMNGLVKAKTTLLEPMYSFKLRVPEEVRGKIMGEMISMRGRIADSKIRDDVFYMEGTYPVASGLYFPTRLAALTGGKGVLSLDFGGYEICPRELGRSTPYVGVNPLDRAKYILHARHAL